MYRSAVFLSLLFTALIASPTRAATTLLFDVTGQRSEKAFGASTPYVQVGAFNFQMSITLDDSAYSYSSLSPLPEGWDYAYEAYPTINNIGSPSINLTEQFAQSHGMGSGTDTTSTDSYNAYAQFLENSQINYSQHHVGFSKIHTEHRITEDPDLPPPFDLSLHKHDSLSDRVSLTHEYAQPQPDVDISSFDAYLSTLQGLMGEQGAFTFQHRAHYSKSLQCNDPLGSLYCYEVPQPSYSGTAILDFNGTATLVGISEVPLPAAAWLFLSALGGLGVLKRARR